MGKMSRDNMLKELELYEYEPDKLSRETLIEALENYYEGAGFNDARKRKLEQMNNDKLKDLYKDILPKESKEGEIPF